MGYHLIILKDNKMETTYITEIDELLEIPEIDENTIIYEAEEEWKPFQLKDKPEYKNYIIKTFRDGMLGQNKFKELANFNKIILQEINQKQEDFAQYVHIAEGEKIKRGDFIARNLKNIEIEVKTRTFKKNIDGEIFFTLTYSEIKSLERMQKLINTKIVYCIFERTGEGLALDKLYSIPVNEIITLHKQKKLKYRNGKNSYLEIPINYCKEDFNGLKEIAET